MNPTNYILIKFYIRMKTGQISLAENLHNCFPKIFDEYCPCCSEFENNSHTTESLIHFLDECKAFIS